MDDDGGVVRALLDAIRVAAAEPTLEWARPPIRLKGGFWAQIWQVELAPNSTDLEGPLVARVMPDPETAARETVIQTHLANNGYPTPRVRLAAGPSRALDQAWMLMDLALGEPLLANLSGLSAIVHLPRLARSLPDQLARHAAELHAIDPSEVPADQGIDALLTRMGDRSETIDRPDLVAVASWLNAHRPSDGRAVICHGDLHPFNILTHPSGDTVLDWSGAQIADPAYDIAYTKILLGRPPLAVPGPIEPFIAAAGRALARRFLATYNAKAPQPVDPDQLDWFTDFHALRVLTDVATWRAQRELEKRADHPYLSLAPQLGEQLSRSTGIETSPD